MKKLSILAASMLFLLSWSVAMAANVTVTAEGPAKYLGMDAWYMVLSVDAGAEGTASYTFSDGIFNSERPGAIVGFHITPDADTPPTTAYDVLLYNSAATTKKDLFQSDGVDLANTDEVDLVVYNLTTGSQAYTPLYSPPTVDMSGLGDGTAGATPQATIYVLILTDRNK